MSWIMNMAEFRAPEGPDDISTEQFIQFIRKRRSHRFFQEREVPWEILKQLVGSASTPPQEAICRWWKSWSLPTGKRYSGFRN